MTSRRSVHSRRRTHRAVARLRPAPLGLAFLVFFVLLPLNAVLAADETLYLVGDGVPKATLSLNPPAAGTLPNYDPDRDDEPGLMLKKTDGGANETDPTKHQIWVWPAKGVVLDGKASLTFWSAMKDFDDSKEGHVEAYLLDCSPSGSDCTVIDSGSIRRNKWSSGWVSRTIAFGSVSYSLPADRSLAVKVVVGNKSDDDMWFAYGVAKYPSALTLSLAAPAVVTTSTTTTTTTSTTTTTVPATTTTTTTTTTVPTTTTTSTTTTTTTSTTTTTTPATTPLTTTTTTTAPATTTPTTTTTTTPPATASGGSGDDPANQDPSDVTLAAIPDSAEAATSGAEIDSGITGDLLEGLELVVSPPIATALGSPLLVLEAFARALSGAGEALLLPGLLLLVGVLYLSNESRLKALLLQGVDAEGSDR